MLKAEQLKILEQIEKLIDHAGADSYIGETFAGVVGICRNNIEDDFANHPVHDLEMMRTRCDAEIRAHEQTKKNFAEYRASTEKVIDDMTEELTMWKYKYSDVCKSAEEWEQNAHDAGDLYGKLEDECAEMTAEIRKLKAEIVRMRMARMTEAEIAGLYDKTEGVN